MFYTHVFPRKVVVLLTSKNDQRKRAVPFVVVFPQSHPESFL